MDTQTEKTENRGRASVRNYKKICKAVGVLPLRKVAAQFGSSHISLRNLTLSSKDVKAACLALHRETTAVSMDFTGNFMKRSELSFLTGALGHLPAVFQLSVCNNELSGQALEDFCSFLVTNSTISRLDLSGNKLDDNDAKPVANMIKTNKTIKTILLSHNEFREVGGRILGEAIAQNRTLLDLDLSWNHLRRCGAIGIARGLQANASLLNVNLSWNGFGFEGCVAIGDMLCKNCTITELDISCNRINPPALLELLRGIASNKTLRILKLGNNPITAGFSSIILAVVKKHKLSALENIDLEGVVVDKEFVSLLGEIQRERFFIVKYEVSLPVKKMSRDEMREKIGLPCAYNVDPLKLLYLLKEKMRASDFFYKINKDHDEGLQKSELYSLFNEAGLPVTGSVVDKIMEFMDTNDDGTIDLREFLLGDKRIKCISRKQIRGDQDRKGQDTNYIKYSRTFQKAHIDPITNALKVDLSSSPRRQPRRPSDDKTAPVDTALDDSLLNLP